MRMLLVIVIGTLMGGMGVSAEAGLVAAVKRTPAGPVLRVNGRTVAPTVFFVNFDTDAKLRPLQLEEIETAGRNGVDIVSVPIGTPWPNEDGKYDHAGTDARIEQILKANPRALIIPRIGVSWPPDWWTASHTDELMLYSDGKRQTASVHSRLWREAAFEHVKAQIAHLESTFGNHMLGYHPCGQHTGEWFYDRSWEGALSGLEQPARDAFRDYVRRRYATDAALRSAWHDPDITLEQVDVPSIREQSRSLAGTFRDPLAERKAIDYLEFRNEEMADVVELMCRAVKESAPSKLSVTFYGYLFELGLPKGMSGSGHLALKRTLGSPYIDVFCSPVSYGDRLPGGIGAFMAPVESVHSHVKLWLVEDDTRTHLGESDQEYALQKTRDARETRGVLTRNFGHVVTRSAAVWWMDLFGVGWFSGDEIWRDLGRLREVYEESLPRTSAYSPEIAVIVDERSALYQEPTHVVDALLMGSFRRQWYRIGAPVGMYLLDDLTAGRVPPARLYLFLNVFRLDPPQIDAIRRYACCDGCTAVWMYAPGIVRGDSLRAANVQEITGIRLAETATGTGEITLTDGGAGFAAEHGRLSPVFRVDDPKASILARYKEGGEPAVASRRIGKWTSVYSGVLQLPASLLRTLAREAGVHIYSDQDDVVAAGNGLISLHASSAGPKKLTMPRECRLIDCADGSDLGRSQVFEFEMLQGDTRLLRIAD